MKKLIATAVVAAATYGAFAIDTGVRFENLERGATSVEVLNTTTGNYWSEAEGAANAYNIVAMDSYSNTTRPGYFKETQTSTNALSVKTTFGKPLSFAVNAKNEGVFLPGDMGIYFDSLIKFTVCEEAPEANLYTETGAKIALWLQEQYDEDDNITGTNLVVRAGNLSYSEALQVTQTDYVCDEVEGDFADAWHRVTIKTIANITTANSKVPGFAIYVDGYPISSDISKWDESFTYTLSEVARNLDELDALFPSLDQAGDDKTKITYAQFDGTGSVNELLFTATNEPDFASDEKYMDPKFTYTHKVDGVDKIEEFETIDELVAYIADFGAGEYTITLAQNISIDSTITIANANGAQIILDLNGCTIENDTANYAITVAQSTRLKIIDNSTEKNGIIDSENAINIANEATFELEGGTIAGKIEVAEESGNLDKGNCSLAGGTVMQDPEYLVAEGFKGVEKEGGFYDIVPLEYFTVTFVLNNGSDNVVIEDVLEGTKASTLEGVPVPEQAGFTFNGWSPALDATTITEDTTFTAQWTAKTYTVSVAPAGANMAVRVTKNGEDVEYAQSYTVNYGDDVSVVYEAVDGYELTGQATFTFSDINANVATTAPTATAISYSITYDVDGIAATTYTVADLNTTIELPTASREDYTFDGWTNETYTTAIKSFTITVLGNVEFYAKWTENTPATPEIAPGTDSVVVDAAETAKPAEVAAKVEIQTPAGVNKADYQALFTKTAEYNSEKGTWTVTAKISEDVEKAVAESATKVLNGVQSAAVEVPQGLFYKVTTMTSLDGADAVETKGQSNGGSISVAKPGDKSGFIKIQIGTKAY